MHHADKKMVSLRELANTKMA